MGQIALTQTIVLGPAQINDIYLAAAGKTVIPLISSVAGQALIFQSAIVSLIGGNGYPYYTDGDFYFSLAGATLPPVPISNKISAHNIFDAATIVNTASPPVISQFTCTNPYPFSITQSNGGILIPIVDSGQAGPNPSQAQGQLSIYITYSILTI